MQKFVLKHSVPYWTRSSLILITVIVFIVNHVVVSADLSGLSSENGTTSDYSDIEVTTQTYCTVPDPPQCELDSINSTSVKIACDLHQTNTSSCQLENIAYQCIAPMETNPNLTWVIRYRNQTFNLINFSGKQSYDMLISDLSESTNYTCNITLNGVSSSHINFTTDEGVASPPENVDILSITSTSFTISWDEPYKIPGILQGYTVSVSRLSFNHYVSDDCLPDNTTSPEEVFEVNTTMFHYADGWPDTNYLVEVSAVTGFVGEVAADNVTTETSTSDAPENLTSTLMETPTADDYIEFSVNLTWNPPCNTNGPESHFVIYIVGVYSEDESYTNNTHFSVDFIKSNSSDPQAVFHHRIGDLMASSQYNVTIWLVGENGDVGDNGTLIFDTPDNFPGPPINLSATNITSTSFVLSWSQPERNSGMILQYILSITEVGPLYINNAEVCFNMTNVTETRIPLDGDINEYQYDFSHPFFEYEVVITANTSQGSGNDSDVINVRTKIDVPDAAKNLRVNILDHSNQSTLSCNIILQATWDEPCYLNGILAGYRVALNGTYTDDDDSNYYIEMFVSDNTLDVQLNASTQYDFTVEVVVTDFENYEKLISEASRVGDIFTNSCYPGLPILSSTHSSNTSFNISWTAPIEVHGPITGYHLTLTEVSPLKIYNLKCTYPNFEKKIEINSTYFQYELARPYYKYEFELAAETEKGLGPSTNGSINTLSGVPDNVASIKTAVSKVTSTNYDSNALVTFEPPCFMNGSWSHYELGYTGTRVSYETVEYSNITLNDTEFQFDLRPDYMYSVVISTVLESGTRNLIRVRDFIAPSGVPQFSHNSSIVTSLETKSESTASITLRRSDFDETNGELLYIALIVSNANVTGGEYAAWKNASEWPVPETDQAAVYYQATEKFWNPFKDIDEVIFVIGNNTNCTSNQQFCNRPLAEATNYYLIVRVFTRDFYTNGYPVGFTTDSIQRVGLIVGLIFGVAGFALAGFILYILWFKRKISCKCFSPALWSETKFYSSRNNSNVISRNPTEPATEITVRKFPSYCKHLENNPEKLKAQYDLLGEKSKELTVDETVVFALKPENRRKNRYTNILPYDETRVKLLIEEDDEISSDYVNASYIKGSSGNIEYIATQGPLPDTCRDFWKMVLQENVSMIIMVSHFVEQNKIKCYKYFPNNHENMMVGDDIEVRCSTDLHFGTYCIRTLQVKKDVKQVVVTHMQFLVWPDFGVPKGTEQMLQFMYQYQERLRLEGGKVIVHCSAGVGRTGTLIATDIIMKEIEKGNNIDVFKTVLDLRKQRVNMVQTEKQYMYIHSLVKDSFNKDPQQHLDVDPTNDEHLYENLPVTTKEHQSVAESEF